jgi:hypothetical protein
MTSARVAEEEDGVAVAAVVQNDAETNEAPDEENQSTSTGDDNDDDEEEEEEVDPNSNHHINSNENRVTLAELEEERDATTVQFMRHVGRHCVVSTLDFGY